MTYITSAHVYTLLCSTDVTFALIVYAHPYLGHATSCTSERAKEEIYLHEGMVAVALTLLRFNSLLFG